MTNIIKLFTNNIYALLLICIIIVIFAVCIYQIRIIKRNNLWNKQFTVVEYDTTKEDFAQVKGGTEYYKVHEDLDNPEGAAESMDRLNTTALAFLDHLNRKYKSIDNIMYYIKPEYVETVKSGLIAMKQNYKPSSLEENIPERSGGDTSYVIDKGSVFAMCLRDPKNNNRLESKLNSLVFVLLHEMTHLFTKTYGHDTYFWNNFKFILQEASDMGIYQPVNYKATGSPYCGIVISYSPLFDYNLDNYYKSE